MPHHPGPLARLLAEARDRVGLSQGGLAELAGVSRETVCRYESGARQPTFRALDAMLAACDLQVRWTLEPLGREVGDQVDALLRDVDALGLLELPRLTQVAAWLEARAEGWTVPMAPPHREGPATWAFDRATALALQGFAADPESPSCADVVVVFDEAAQWWLTSLNLLARPWLDMTFEQSEPLLRGLTFSLGGALRIRLVQQLPRVVEVRGFPVVRLDEVERAHPEWAAALARLRQQGHGAPERA